MNGPSVTECSPGSPSILSPSSPTMQASRADSGDSTSSTEEAWELLPATQDPEEASGPEGGSKAAQQVGLPPASYCSCPWRPSADGHTAASQ